MPCSAAGSVMVVVMPVVVVMVMVVRVLGLCMHGDMLDVLHHLVDACLLKVVGFVEFHLISLEVFEGTLDICPVALSSPVEILVYVLDDLLLLLFPEI